jgi:hypothetical protein
MIHEHGLRCRDAVALFYTSILEHCEILHLDCCFEMPMFAVHAMNSDSRLSFGECQCRRIGCMCRKRALVFVRCTNAEGQRTRRRGGDHKVGSRVVGNLAAGGNKKQCGIEKRRRDTRNAIFKAKVDWLPDSATSGNATSTFPLSARNFVSKASLRSTRLGLLKGARRGRQSLAQQSVRVFLDFR